jgi:tetratricopeptide (TPR) repeat protein
VVHDLVTQARKLDLSGHQAAAIANYRQAIALDSNSYDAEYGVARALDLTGAYEEARTHFARALTLAPEGEKDQVMRMTGISWTFSGNLAAADAEFRKVFDRQLAARSFGAAAEEANELGRLHLEMGDPDSAEHWYRVGHDVARQASDLAPWQLDLADLRWAHAQARIAIRRGLAEEARDHAAVAKRLIAKGGNDDQKVQYAYLLGYISFYRGNYKDAAAALATADQKDPAVLLLRAEAAEKLSEAEEATKYYRQVVESSAHSLTSAFARPEAQRKLAR